MSRGSGQERKFVTVLFADLVGFTSRAERMDPEDVAALLAPYHARLRGELERHGGTVEKFIGDAVMAVFGAPTAHEDDPERAVRAALAIRDWAAEEEHGVEVRIGVNSGEALVTLAPREGEGMAAGDVVNTAARLQSAAPVGGILVGEQTYRATERAIEYREANPVDAKGKARPVPVWEAVQARSRFGEDVPARPRTALVGRQRELDVLVDALARARQSHEPQLVTLVGVPGIGKSRLVLELFRAVEADPELIFWRQGRCLPYGDGVAYWALGEIAKAQAGILDSDDSERAAGKLRRTVADLLGQPAEAQWVEGHMRPLLGLVGEDAGGGEDRRSEAFAAWRRFLEALAERDPLVLVFEDLHWADEGLLDFVDYLVDWASGVALLVVCTARPELLDRRPGWGGGKRNAMTLSLAPLSDAETARLVADLLHRAVLPADVQQALLVRAGGNPLYAEEYGRMFLERGSAVDLPLPETVQGLIAARLDALPVGEKDLVQDAAVVGKVFWASALAAISGRERFEVEERLHALERKEFLRRERRSSVEGETQYAFLHLLVRDVAYAQIPRAGRAEKHRLVSGWIESLSPDRSEDRAEMLAHHYLQALELAEAAGLETAALAERARLALREAGDRADSLSSFLAAARFYSAALRLWPEDDPERPQLLFRRALVLDFGEEAIGLLAEARDALLAAGDRERAAITETRLAAQFWEFGQRDDAYEHMDRAVALVDPAQASAAKAHVLTNRARFHMLAGENEDAIRIGEEALALASQFQLEALQAAVLTSVGTARSKAGDRRAGMADLERSLEIAMHVNDPGVLHRAHNNLANVCWHAGELPRATEIVAEMRRWAERFGLPSLLRWVQGEEVIDRHLTGKWTEVEPIAEEFLVAGWPHYQEASCRVHRAEVRLARGDAAGAAEDTERALELARQAKDLQLLAPALIARARALLAGGHEREASMLADEVLELKAGSVAFVTDIWLVVLAWFLCDLGRPAEFLRASEGIPESRWLEAARLISSGELVPAADVLGQMGALGQEAYARLRAGEVLVGTGRRAEADVQLRTALAFFREQEATAYLRRGEALLAASA